MDAPQSFAEALELFGDPRSPDDPTQVNPEWEAENIVLVRPAGWSLQRITAVGPHPCRGIRAHKLIQPAVEAALADILAHGDVTPGMSICGGGYNFRPQRDSSKLSCHALGIAIDWDPLAMPRGVPWNPANPQHFPEWWFDAWADHGFSDGRHFHVPDPMHVQFATGF